MSILSMDFQRDWVVEEMHTTCYVCCHPLDKPMQRPARHRVNSREWKKHHKPVGLFTNDWAIPWEEWAANK